MSDNLGLAEKARSGAVVDRTYADVNQLAFAIVHALEDRDSGLTAEIDALRRQVAALSSTGGDSTGGAGVDLTVLEAVVAREPELRHELNGAFQQVLDQARGGESASSATLMPLLALSISQALRRRDAELGGALRQIQEQVSELSQQVATMAQTLGTVRSRVDHRTELSSLRDLLSSELGALRDQVGAIESGDAPARGKAPNKARRRGAARSATADGAAPKPMPMSEIRLVFDILRRGGPELDGKLEFLRQMGYERAIQKSGDPKVEVSPAAALLLGVAALLEERSVD